MTNAAGRPSRFLTLLLGLAVVSAASCESCATSARGGGGGDSTGGSSSWLVGAAGLMLAAAADGPVGRYPLALTSDLRAIACWGKTRAWVAGDEGVLLTTKDAGATWQAVDAGVRTRLHAIAIAEKGIGFVGGDAGVLRVTTDNGATWSAIGGAPANATWTSIAARHDGAVALATTAAGDIYGYDRAANRLILLAAAPAGPLTSVALSHDGNTAVAVGDAGAMLLSTDGGRTWRDRPSGTTHALNDVWLAGPEGDTVIAVGAGGVLVMGPTTAMDGASPRLLGEGRTLRGVHLEDSGHGTIVGDNGTILMTDDFGLSWSPRPSGDARDIFAVDALGEDHAHF
ncbi:MAG TPA: YCF48-related protein, partial [Polyangia bacterium]